ncbi:hypothetical protein GCM10022233_87720 [Streptomyces shaanxiensis]|uniref:Uncharacterized protein n=1 Tax=Streptomyces shaanxiensis TaxID=653357 RepID=A0ABP7WKF4_9ACTN
MRGLAPSLHRRHHGSTVDRLEGPMRVRKIVANGSAPVSDPQVKQLDRVALDLLRVAREADAESMQDLGEVVEKFQKVQSMFGFRQQLAPAPGQGHELIRNCQALAVDLRAKAWNMVGLEKVFAGDRKREAHNVQEPFSLQERAEAERALACYRGETFFETAVWYLLQLDPIDKVVLGGLASVLGRAVAVRNSEKLRERLQDVQKHTIAPGRDQLAGVENLPVEEPDACQAERQLPNLDREIKPRPRGPEAGGGLF